MTTSELLKTVQDAAQAFANAQSARLTKYEDLQAQHAHLVSEVATLRKALLAVKRKVASADTRVAQAQENAQFYRGHMAKYRGDLVEARRMLRKSN